MLPRLRARGVAEERAGQLFADPALGMLSATTTGLVGAIVGRWHLCQGELPAGSDEWHLQNLMGGNSRGCLVYKTVEHRIFKLDDAVATAATEPWELLEAAAGATGRLHGEAPRSLHDFVEGMHAAHAFCHGCLFGWRPRLRWLS